VATQPTPRPTHPRSIQLNARDRVSLFPNFERMSA
jgi:hypothetical protein